MAQKSSSGEAAYFLGFDGGGTKTECVVARADGEILARVFAGPSNPLRTSYTRAWFSLGEAADAVLGRQKIRAGDIGGICAGIGGAGRASVGKRISSFFERSYPNARVRVTTDLEIALQAAFGDGEGVILLAGTGSAALGRDSGGRTARFGGRGPWFSDEGSAFDIGRRAFAAVGYAEEHRGPATALSNRLFKFHQAHDWDALYERIAKNPDDVFPQTFPLVAQLADKEDSVCREILSTAAASLAALAGSVAKELGWGEREFPIATVGGVYGRSKFFDAAIATELKKIAPGARLLSPGISPAEAAVKMAIRSGGTNGNAA
jgi:N-acetylglucosamine kinase-like BadF-type ATPase